MTKTERQCRWQIAQLRDLFERPSHPNVPVPLPRGLRRAARYLERRGYFVSQDAVRRPGSTTIVRGYLLTSREKARAERDAAREVTRNLQET